MRLINWDCLLEMQKLEDNSIDCIITDPPYGVNFKNNFYNDNKDYVFNIYQEWMYEFFRITKDWWHIYIFIPTLEIDKWVKAVKESWLNFKNILITRSKASYPWDNNYLLDTQFVLFATKWKWRDLNKIDFQKTSKTWLGDKRNKNPKEFTYKYSSIFNYFWPQVSSHNIHPNQKNIEFTELLLKLSTNEKDIVLDPFLWSGTTWVASKNLNRDFIWIELDEEYFSISKERIWI